MLIVSVDGDGAFRRVVGRTVRGVTDIVDLEGVGGLHHLLPQVDAGVGGLHRVGGHPVGTVPVLEPLDEGLVLRGVHGLVVVPGGQLALDVVRADALDLLLGDGHRHDRHGRSVQPDAVVLAEEGDVGVTVEGVEHRVRPGTLDAVGHGGEVGGAQRGVVLADDLHVVFLGVLLDDEVRGAGEDVVGAEQEERLRALLLPQVVQCGDDLLVGGGTGVEDVVGRFQPLVLHRVEQQRVVALEDRQHRLAGRRGPAAEDGGDAFLLDQSLGTLGEGGGFGRTVLLLDLEFLAEHTAVVVDLLDRHLQGLVDGGLADGHGAGQRVDQADLDRVARGVEAGLCIGGVITGAGSGA